MDNVSAKAIGERLKQARSKKFSSAAKAAAALGVNSSTYRAHENGQIPVNIQTAVLYGDFFGCAPEWLMTGADRLETRGRPRKARPDYAQLLTDLAKDLNSKTPEETKVILLETARHIRETNQSMAKLKRLFSQVMDDV